MGGRCCQWKPAPHQSIGAPGETFPLGLPAATRSGLGLMADGAPAVLEQWPTFGPRASLRTGGPFRATTPGNALLNYLYAILESEMTVALLAAGLDPGIGIFHSDIDRRPSLTLDAIEAVRPHVDYWLFTYLASSAFANRDFTELSDGLICLSHPLTSHLAHTAALCRLCLRRHRRHYVSFLTMSGTLWCGPTLSAKMFRP